MAISFNKKELEKKKQTKKLEKQKRKEERKSSGPSKSFDDMIAYVDENGSISSTPPDPNKKQKVEAENIAVSTPKKGEVEPTVLNGRVEHFNKEKGYGFIKDINGTEKYFFNIVNAPNSIAEGDIISFELEYGLRGMNAVRITITNKKEH
jgi:cold shock CspA family protein